MKARTGWFKRDASLYEFIPDCMTSLSVDPCASVFLSFSDSITSLVRCFFSRELQSSDDWSFSNPFSTYSTSSGLSAASTASAAAAGASFLASSMASATASGAGGRLLGSAGLAGTDEQMLGIWKKNRLL